MSRLNKTVTEMSELQKVLKEVKYIAFDADDTLWVNEPYFRRAEEEYCSLLQRFASRDEIIATLYGVEMKNLAPYGYGAKAFTLSLMETAIRLSNDGNAAPLTPAEMEEVIRIGTSLISIPIDILPGVKELLEKLSGSGKYTLVLATKGDLLDQQRKLEKSALAGYFQYIEVMSDKNRDAYMKLLGKLGCAPEEFLMIGNSLKSDILPVLEVGAYAVYVPFHSTWEHEKVDGEVIHSNLFSCGCSADLPDLFLEF